MTSCAVLDFVGLPASYPGYLECRLRRVHYRADGSVIDDGSRSGEKQVGCHRFVLRPGDDVEAEVDRHFEASAPLGKEGYDRCATTLMHLVASHEWRPEVLAARREALRVNGPTLRLVVRALGFDLGGAGELAIGLGKAVISGPEHVTITGKSSIKLLPGDPVELAIEAIRAHAAEREFQPPTEADLSLLRHVAAALWTPARIEAREQAWLAWERTAPLPLAAGRALEFAERLHPLGDWHPISSEPSLARLQ